MLNRIFIVILLLSRSVSSFSQADTIACGGKVNPAFKISLDGSLLYPGASLGIELPAYGVVLVRKSGIADSVTRIKDRFVSLNAGWYHHKDFHDNLYFTAKWIMRGSGRKGFFTEFCPGLGYSRTFLGGTAYTVTNDGTVGIDKAAGYSYAVATVGGGAGYDFSGLKGIPLSLYYGVSILFMFPYNSTIYYRPVMELGIIWHPDNIFPLTVNRKVKRQ